MWQVSSVADCLAPVPFVGRTKVQSRDYRRAGLFPVIDQGQSEIAGWTDDENAVISEPLPVVVFGDHTRVLKYIDFPFARGADGTQILKPKGGIDALYFYYALRALDLPARGYNRHFALLREQLVGLPLQREQLAIARALRLTEDAVALEKRLVECALALKDVAMREIFTRGLRGEPQKETEIGTVPEGWKAVEIADLGEVITGTTPPTKEARNYQGGDIPFVSPGDFEHGVEITKTTRRITARGLAVARPLPRGTTCFVCIGATIGKVGVTAFDVCATNQQINAVVPKPGDQGGFVFYLMTRWAQYVRSQASPGPMPILSKGVFEKIILYEPADTAERSEISRILAAIDRKIELHRQKKVLLEKLFNALLDGLMAGEISVSSLNLSALEKPAPGATPLTIAAAV